VGGMTNEELEHLIRSSGAILDGNEGKSDLTDGA
jgi:hypothetical protein